MSGKWVDNTGYFGPDRRRRGGMRLVDRRRDDETTNQLPPLGALLRRVRVQVASTEAEDRRRAVQLLAGAMNQAHSLGYEECCQALRLAENALKQASDEEAVAAAEEHIAQAMDHAAAGR
jgi:hypothetical protein